MNHHFIAKVRACGITLVVLISCQTDVSDLEPVHRVASMVVTPSITLSKRLQIPHVEKPSPRTGMLKKPTFAHHVPAISPLSWKWTTQKQQAMDDTHTLSFDTLKCAFVPTQDAAESGTRTSATVFCTDVSLSQEVWSKHVQGTFVQHGILHTDGKALFVISYSYVAQEAYVYAFALKTGKRLWSHKLYHEPNKNTVLSTYYHDIQSVVAGHVLAIYTKSNMALHAFHISMKSGRRLGHSTYDFEWARLQRPKTSRAQILPLGTSSYIIAGKSMGPDDEFHMKCSTHKKTLHVARQDLAGDKQWSIDVALPQGCHFVRAQSDASALYILTWSAAEKGSTLHRLNPANGTRTWSKSISFKPQEHEALTVHGSYPMLFVHEPQGDALIAFHPHSGDRIFHHLFTH